MTFSNGFDGHQRANGRILPLAVDGATRDQSHIPQFAYVAHEAVGTAEPGLLHHLAEGDALTLALPIKDDQENMPLAGSDPLRPRCEGSIGFLHLLFS